MSHATAPARVRPSRGGTPEPARTPARRGLRVVPAAIERSGNGPFALACMTLLTLGLLALLVLNTQLAQGTFAVHDLAQRSGTLADQEHELTRALDAERNPGALAAKAVALGMVPATSMAFIRLADGTIVGVAEPAKGDKPVTIVTTPKAPPPAPPAPAAPAPAAPDAPAPAPAAPAPGTPGAPAPAAPAAPAPVAPAAPAQGQ